MRPGRAAPRAVQPSSGSRPLRGGAGLRAPVAALSLVLSLSLVLAACLLGAAPAAARSANGPGARALSFAVVPQKSAAATLRDWSPLADWLSRRIGAPVRLVTAADIPAFESCLARGAYDIAYMNPYHFTVFNADPGYRAVAHRRGPGLRGVLVARRDGPVRTLEALDGRPLAFPSPAAFGASLITRAELRARGVEVLPRYVRSHESVYLAVARGLVPAGGGVARTLRTMPQAVQDQLVVIHRTAAYTPHAIAVAPHASADLRARLSRAFADAGAAPQQPLERLGFNALDPAGDADWDDVRALGISPEDAGLQRSWRSQCLSE